MKPDSTPDWLTEHEKNYSVFLLEWLAIFAGAWLFWTCVFFELHVSTSSVVTAAAISALYACLLVFPRLFQETGCKKCNSLVPLVREEIGRRRLRNEEKCVEVEHGGPEWMEHWIDIYSGIHQVEIVRYRCRRCGAVWDELGRSPASHYKHVRTINLRKQLYLAPKFKRRHTP